MALMNVLYYLSFLLCLMNEAQKTFYTRSNPWCVNLELGVTLLTWVQELPGSNHGRHTRYHIHRDLPQILLASAMKLATATYFIYSFMNSFPFCEIWGYHGEEDDDGELLGFEAMWTPR